MKKKIIKNIFIALYVTFFYKYQHYSIKIKL